MSKNLSRVTDKLIEANMKNKKLEKENAELNKQKEQIKSIANNLLYWDTCPDSYKEAIVEIYGWQEELNEIRSKANECF